MDTVAAILDEEMDDIDPTSSNLDNFGSLFQNWQYITSGCVAVVHATASAWLHLTNVATALHLSRKTSSEIEREQTRFMLVKRISESDTECQALLRMSPSAFEMLCSMVRTSQGWREFQRSTVEKQVIVFLFIVGQNFKNRAVQFFLCRSGETVSRYFHNVLASVICLEANLLIQPTGETVSPIINSNRRFFPYLKDCVGAIDGTHVRVKDSRHDAPRYRGRKDWPTQNVLATCSFELQFTYVLAGWEGSAADSRIIRDAFAREDPLVIPTGKYYLVDAGFGLTSSLITPYGRTRYHLKEYSVRGPETAEKLFNHRHASLRNSIERAFGVLKKRFPILASGTEAQYRSSTMTDIILGCCVLHNFLLIYDRFDIPEYNVESSERMDAQTSNGDNHGEMVNDSSLEYSRGEDLRIEIAAAM